MATGELIQHFSAVKLRVNGSGNLKMKLMSMDDIYEKDLAPIVMSAATSKYPIVLTNFVQERASLRIEVTDIDETFTIDQILIFVKPIFTAYPG